MTDDMKPKCCRTCGMPVSLWGDKGDGVITMYRFCPACRARYGKKQKDFRHRLKLAGRAKGWEVKPDDRR